MTKIFKTIKKIELLHQLIRTEKTGTPNELAKRLDVSRSTVYKLIEELRACNIMISYSRKKESFSYDEDTDLEIQFSIKVIKDKDKLTKINGGSSLFSFRMHFQTEE